jgi:hypothetical protein
MNDQFKAIYCRGSFRNAAFRVWPLILGILCAWPIPGVTTTVNAQWRSLDMGEVPINNPHKGLVPYARPTPGRFPHSMEFNYLGLARLVKEVDQFDWQPLEDLLNDIASRGNQAVVRIYLEYPGKKDGIPSFLVSRGMKVHTYMNTNTAPLPPTEVSTPDYENPLLRQTLAKFIQAFGEKYDGDPRLGYITAGLLGTWGEWHTYPRSDLWASKAVQTEVMDAYEKYFVKTPILLRYPAGQGHYDKAPNVHRGFGYHDDSLCWATLQTDRKEDDWFFVPALKAAGKPALDKWKTAPIGGEIRPEVWGKIFDDTIGIPQAQPFDRCAEELHLTWTMDTGMFREAGSDQRQANARRMVAKLGYIFHVDQCSFPNAHREETMMPIAIHVRNHGLAPMYHAWPLELAAAKPTGQIVRTWPMPWTLTGILPGPDGQELTASVSTKGIAGGKHHLLLRVVNPLANGKPLQFANASWNATQPGWLTLGGIEF